MKRGMKRGLLGLMLGLVLSAGTGQAAGATTFGNNLSGPSNQVVGNVVTFANQTLGPAHVLPAGALAPSDGVIVRWRIKVGAEDPGQTAALRVIRNNVGRGKGATEAIPTAAGTYEYATRLPVKFGDQIGIDSTDSLEAVADSASGDTYEYWNPPLPEGGAGTVPNASNGMASTLQVNADVEPDADGDEWGDETQDQCPTDASTHGPCPVVTLPPPPAPETTLTLTPKAKSTQKEARFEFNSDQVGATFECSLDGAGFSTCNAPRILRVGTGSHNFQVRAVNSGLTDATPASYDWKVVKKKHKKHHHGPHGHG
jgi:hypothetical protein